VRKQETFTKQTKEEIKEIVREVMPEKPKK